MSANEQKDTSFKPPSMIRRTESGGVDVMHAVGGIRGIVEGILPGLLFLVVQTFTQNLQLALIIALVAAGIFAIWRLAQRGPLIQSLSGIAGVAICAFVAMRSGSATEYYLPGFFVNAGYAALIILSIIVRWPVLGLFYSFFRGEEKTWRKDKQRLRVYSLATGVFVGMFILRLVVQLPLYFADQITALGTARILMGVPLYAAFIWVTWMMTRKPEAIQEEQIKVEKDS